MALVAWVAAALLIWLGVDVGLNVVGIALSSSVLVFGGGGRTLDGVLGRMQRRALEKENAREG